MPLPEPKGRPVIAGEARLSRKSGRECTVFVDGFFSEPTAGEDKRLYDTDEA